MEDRGISLVLEEQGVFNQICKISLHSKGSEVQRRMIFKGLLEDDLRGIFML